jgi:hypothetical protein
MIEVAVFLSLRLNAPPPKSRFFGFYVNGVTLADGMEGDQ